MNKSIPLDVLCRYWNPIKTKIRHKTQPVNAKHTQCQCRHIIIVIKDVNNSVPRLLYYINLLNDEILITGIGLLLVNMMRSCHPVILIKRKFDDDDDDDDNNDDDDDDDFQNAPADLRHDMIFFSWPAVHSLKNTPRKVRTITLPRTMHFLVLYFDSGI